MFLWRAGNDLLETKGNLYSRKSAKNPLCLVCHNEARTILHILWQCHAGNDIWAKTKSLVQK